MKNELMVDKYESKFWNIIFFCLRKITRNKKNIKIKIDKVGNRRWYKDNLLHRDDGPAVEHKNGSKYYYSNGKRHRLDGPAKEYKGYKECWLGGKIL